MLCLCLALSSFAQDAPPPQPAGQSAQPAPTPPITLIQRSHDERERQYRAEHRIVLNVFVSEASGKPAIGLKQEDFTLLDNGAARALTSFRALKGSAGIAPVRVMLMVDGVNNSPHDVAGDGRAIEKFLKQSPALLAYQTSIAVLSASGASVGRPSRDRDALIGEVRTRSIHVPMFDCEEDGRGSDLGSPPTTSGARDLSGMVVAPRGERGSSCLNRRFQLSISALRRLALEQKEIPGRVILVWIGRGWPLLAAREFRPDTAAIRQNFFDNLVDVTNTLREAQVTLDAAFSPDLFRTVEPRSDHDNAFFNGVPSEVQVTASSLGLQMLAHQSGGQILTESKDLASEIARCVGDAESYYALSFDSPSAASPGEYHSLEVNVNKPGLKARTNTNYYAQP